MLPWLRLDKEVAFGKVKIAPFAMVRPVLEDATGETAAAIAATFSDRRGNPVEPSVCCFADRHPSAPLSEEDVEVLREHIAFGSLAAIAENRYLSHHPDQRGALPPHLPALRARDGHSRPCQAPSRRARALRRVADRGDARDDPARS
jgi:hypothetical protein